MRIEERTQWTYSSNTLNKSKLCLSPLKNLYIQFVFRDRIESRATVSLRMSIFLSIHYLCLLQVLTLAKTCEETENIRTCEKNKEAFLHYFIPPNHKGWVEKIPLKLRIFSLFTYFLLSQSRRFEAYCRRVLIVKDIPAIPV